MPSSPKRGHEKALFYLLKEGFGDVAGGYGAETLDAHVEFVVFLDADDVAFGAFQWALDDTELVAFGEVGIVFIIEVETLDAGGGDNLEHPDFMLGNLRRHPLVGCVPMAVEHDLVEKQPLDVFRLTPRGVKEYQIGDDRDLEFLVLFLLLVPIGFHSVVEIVQTLGDEIGFDGLAFAKEHFESVPMPVAAWRCHGRK